ncbi:hypothetical protein [Spirosoma luteolum]
MKTPYSRVVRQAVQFGSLLLLISVASCRELDGPQGPAVASGPLATANPVFGRVNAQPINYKSKTHIGTADLFIPFPASVPVSTTDESVICVYVKQAVHAASGSPVERWFSVPGETATGNEYSFYMAAESKSTLSGIFLRRVANHQAGTETFDAVRILILPARSGVRGQRSASPLSTLK